MKRSELMPARAGRSKLTTVQKAALGGALALVAAPLIRILAQNLRKRSAAPLNPDEHKSEADIDKTLKDTFPASDPPSSSYYDIPVNRQ